MEWIIAKDNPPKDGESIICSGGRGGWFVPSGLAQQEGGAVLAKTNGKWREVYAYMIIPEAPAKPRRAPRLQSREIYQKAERKREITHRRGEWPFNLLVAVNKCFGQDECLERIVLNEVLPNGFCERIDLALNDLTERERAIVLQYYKDGDTLEKISKRYCLTRERIRQILQKGVRRLGSPARISKMRGDYEERSGLEKRISEFGISTRAKHALLRAGVTTGANLMMLSDEDIMGLRNVGSGTFAEIKELQRNILSIEEKISQKSQKSVLE